MLGLPKHLLESLNKYSHDSGEMLRQAQHDVLLEVNGRLAAVARPLLRRGAGCQTFLRRA
jgi:hypothetical protein